MMMVAVTAQREDEGVAAVRAVNAVEHTALDEHVERPEHGRASDGRLTALENSHELVGCKEPACTLNRLDDCTARRCQAVSRLL